MCEANEKSKRLCGLADITYSDNARKQQLIDNFAIYNYFNDMLVYSSEHYCKTVYSANKAAN